MGSKRITSRELAQLAGVSTATISRAFSPKARINVLTRNRILSIAREHNYQPNAIARSLNSRRSHLVAVVVNTVGNPCESEQLDLLVHRIQDRGLLPIVLCCAGADDRVQLMRLASTYQVDHAVIFSDVVSVEHALEIFRGLRPIIVTFEPVDDRQMSTIQVDGSEAAQTVIAKIFDDGRRHFAYLTGRDSSWIDKQRKAWFERALVDRGLSFEATGRGDYTYDSGYKETVLLLRRHKIDALICGNDVMAIGACDAARRLLNRSIPDDLAVVGQDGIAMAAWESHDITTLAQDHHAFVDAVIALIDRERAQEDGVQLKLSCRVRWGATT